MVKIFFIYYNSIIIHSYIMPGNKLFLRFESVLIIHTLLHILKEIAWYDF